MVVYRVAGGLAGGGPNVSGPRAAADSIAGANDVGQLAMSARRGALAAAGASILPPSNIRFWGRLALGSQGGARQGVC